MLTQMRISEPGKTGVRLMDYVNVNISILAVIIAIVYKTVGGN